jgi:hypothetical protein
MIKKEILKTVIAVYMLILVSIFVYIMKDLFWNKDTSSSSIQTLNISSLDKANEGLEDRLYDDTDIPLELTNFQFGDADPFR